MMRVTGCSTTLWSMLPAGPAGPAPLSSSCSPRTRPANRLGGSGRVQRPGPNFPGELGEPIPAPALREPQPQEITTSSTTPKEEETTRHPERTRADRTLHPRHRLGLRPPPPRKMEAGSGGAAAPAPRRSRPAAPGGARGLQWRAGAEAVVWAFAGCSGRWAHSQEGLSDWKA